MAIHALLFVPVILAGTLIGLAGLLYAHYHWRRYRLLAGVTRTCLDDIDSPGPVWLQGTITNPDGHAGPALVEGTDRPAVSAWQLKQYDLFALFDVKIFGKTLLLDVDSVTFGLQTGEGSITIEPPDGRPGFVKPATLVSKGLTGVALKDVVAEFHDFPVVDEDATWFFQPEGKAYMSGRPRLKERLRQPDIMPSRLKFHQRALSPGTEVGILGYVVADDDVEEVRGVDDLVVRGFPGWRKPFVISTKDRTELIRSSKRRMVVGAIVAVLGIAIAIGAASIWQIV